MEIFPAILTDSLRTAQEQLDLVQESGVFSVVQVDIIDGYFADSITLTPADLVECAWGELEIDIHLLTVDPLDYVQELIEFKQQLPIRSIITQVEKLSAPQAFITEVQHQDWQVGFSLDLFTTIDAIDVELCPQLDIVQVMGNEGGFQGKELHPRALQTLAEVQAVMVQQKYNWDIFCDVGMNRDTLELVKKAGATGAAVGSALWRATDFNRVANELLALATK